MANINIPKVIVLVMALGVTSYAVWYVFAALRREVSTELHIHQYYK